MTIKNKPPVKENFIEEEYKGYFDQVLSESVMNPEAAEVIRQTFFAGAMVMFDEMLEILTLINEVTEPEDSDYLSKRITANHRELQEFKTRLKIEGELRRLTSMSKEELLQELEAQTARMKHRLRKEAEGKK